VGVLSGRARAPPAAIVAGPLDLQRAFVV